MATRHTLALMPGWRARALLVFFGMLLALGTTEAALRFREREFRRGMEAANGWDPDQACNCADSELVYRPIPGRCGANSRGFVDVEHRVPKPEGVFRIVVVGDSIAIGHPHAYWNSFANVLERLANELCTRRAVEVVVLAVPGYSSSQEEVILEREAMRYEPDLIVWSYCLNDPAHPLYHDSNGQLGRYFHRPALYVADLVERGLFSAREWWRARTRRCPAEFHEFLHCAYRDEVRATFAQLARFGAASGVPIVVAIHPLIERDGSPETYPLADLHEVLRRLASNDGLTVVDLVPAYRGATWQEIGVGYDERGWFDCYHPNAWGHELAGRYLLSQLVKRSLVPCEAGAVGVGSSGQGVDERMHVRRSSPRAVDHSRTRSR
ncbi:MAG TPA: SGNH/GDSL hydrolase family protein [Candidatus Binatia bacterium]|nr:SGNH/GDSL hydrolase family protein [Candidatus Binatia bacterium]